MELKSSLELYQINMILERLTVYECTIKRPGCLFYFLRGEVVEGANSKRSAYLKKHFFLPQSFDLKVTPVFQVSNEQKLQHFAPRLERIFSLLSSVFERFVITTFLISDRAMSSNGPFS